MLARRIALLSASLICALSLGAGAAHAAFIPDPNFGSGGFQRLVLGTEDDALVDSEVQPDGKIVSCGTAELFSDQAIVVTRVNPNGSPDDSFSGDGRVYLPLSFGCNGVELDSTGRIYVGNRGNGGAVDAQVARLDPTGDIDSGYGTGGYGTWDNPDSVVSATDLGPGNKIVGVGFNGGQSISDIFVARLDSGGDPDTTFNATGSRIVSYGSYEDRANAVSVGADSRVTIAGMVSQDVPPSSPDREHFMVGRFTAAGAPDTSFGSGTGRRIFRVGIIHDTLAGLQVLPDGSAIGAGYAFLSSGGGGHSGVVTRVTAAGALDTSFGTGGFITLSNQGGDDQLTGVKLGADGLLVASGYRLSGPAQLFRFSQAGVPDTGFAPAGVLNLDSGLTGEFANAVTFDAAGRIIASGGADNGPDNDAMLFAAKEAPAPPIAPPPPSQEPIAKILSPKAGNASKLTKISGSASGGAISRVQLAIERVNKKLLKKKSCVFIKNTKRATKKVKVKTTKSCGISVTINAKGTSSWSLKFSKSLPVGQYRITAIAVASNGAKTATFSKSRGNQVLLRVKPKKKS